MLINFRAFQAIFGYAIIKPLSKAIPENTILGKLLGGPFGPKENCTVQSAATGENLQLVVVKPKV